MNAGVFDANPISKRWLVMLLLVVGVMMYSSEDFAFYCTTNGVQLDNGGTFIVPIDVTLKKDADYIVLTNMASYTGCAGTTGFPYYDALRSETLTIAPELKTHGYTGYIEVKSVKYLNPIGENCIWSDVDCAEVGSPNHPGIGPMEVIVGVKNTSVKGNTSFTIPAGSEIARLVAKQRAGAGSWTGVTETWIFKARTDVVAPNYTCSWNNSTITVLMPGVIKEDMLKHGVGTYPEKKAFDLQLSCETGTDVSIQFTGQTMAGHDDVLANLTDPDSSVGVQILYKDKSVIMGEVIKVIHGAKDMENLHFMGTYYYNGKELSVGKVSAAADVELTYE